MVIQSDNFVPELKDSQSDVILSFKKNAEAQARQKKMIEHTDVDDQHNNAVNSGKDSLPQESSTPKNDEKDNGKYYTRQLIIYMLFAGWEVRIVKNCDRGHSFSLYGPT